MVLQEFLIEKIAVTDRIILMLKKNLLLFIGALAIAALVYGQARGSQPRKLVLFYSPNCQKCAVVDSKLIPAIEMRFKGRIILEKRDITQVDNYKLLRGLQEKYNAKDLKGTVPIFFFEGYFLGADTPLETTLPAFIESGLRRPPTEETFNLNGDLLKYFLSFRPLAVISAGLIDGINPCAFTVMVFFISFLALQGYRRKELLAIGLTFISAVFLTYCFIGIGLFGFLYRLEGFWLASQIINTTIGIFSIVLGCLALYDFFKFLKTKKTEGLILQLPQAIKNRIHKIVGMHYRKGPSDTGGSKSKIFNLLLSALITGFLVSILEAVCTGQVYLPTIVFVFKTSHLKLQSLGYLLLYNLMFIVPLLIVFFFALLGTSSEQFSAFLKKHLLITKVLMAVIFFILGIALLYTQGTPGAPISVTPQELPATVAVHPVALPEAEPGDVFSWNFGELKAGNVVKHVFIFKNRSQKQQNIKDVTTSCGCAISKVEKRSLKPGEETAIEVEFNSKGYSGEVKQYVYLHTEDPDNPVVRFIIQAKVNP
jgi:hypothetical protein